MKSTKFHCGALMTKYISKNNGYYELGLGYYLEKYLEQLFVKL